MNNNLNFQDETRAELHAAAAEIRPQKAFTERLEANLLARWERAAQREPQQRARPGWANILARHRWAAAGASLLLVAAAILGLLGPQRVWADLLGLLGYVPGVGFVDLDETRVLAAPVELTRDGVTLRVEQVVAGTNKTTVVIDSTGLPPAERSRVQRAADETNWTPVLRLPDGRTLPASEWDVLRGKGTLRFPPLDEGVYRVTLELSRLPLVEPGAAAEGWAIPLTLRPATEELLSELFPQPYAPTGAVDAHEDITLRVLAVAHSPQETALQVQVQWREPDWYLPRLGVYRTPHLQDDLGHVYQEGLPPGTGSVAVREIARIAPEQEDAPALPSYEQTMSFAPVSAWATRLTLQVDQIAFALPVEGEFSIDLGDDPQVGDRWPLDIHLNVAGLALHITGARLVKAPVPARDGDVLERQLEFEFAPLPAQGNRVLENIILDGSAAGFSGAGSRGTIPDGRTHLSIGEGQPIPTGRVSVRVKEAQVRFAGPWQIEWTVPGAGETGVAPAVLRPDKAAQTRSAVTLRVDEVAQTDRLVAVTVSGEVSLPGAALGWDTPLWDVSALMLGWDPALRRAGEWPEETRHLHDERGRRYQAAQGIAWRPHPDGANAAPGDGPFLETLFFDPMQPFARRATLHIPAVAVTLPGAATFELDVPPGQAMHAGLETAERASEPWTVDIPVEIGAYPLRFVQAQLQERHGQVWVVLGSDPLKGQQGNQWLDGFHLAQVSDPAGRAVDLSRAYATATPDETEGLYRVWLIFSASDPATHSLQPGRYRVELDGILVAVKGPWTLTWERKIR